MGLFTKMRPPFTCLRKLTREPDPQETKVKKILSSVFAVVFAMAFSLVCQPSVSSAAPQGAPATRQNQPAHQSVRNVKQNHAAPAAAGREPQSSRSEKAHGSAGNRKAPGTGMEEKGQSRAPREKSAR